MVFDIHCQYLQQIEIYLDQQYSEPVSNKNLALHWRQDSCPVTTLIFLVFSCWAIWRVITCSPFNFATIFNQYCTTFTFPPLKKITKHRFIIQHMVIPFSFKFTNPALHKYTSSSSLSKSSKFLILQFLVKCCKLHSVFKILSKSHMLDIFLILSVYYKFSYKLWFLSLKEFK